MTAAAVQPPFAYFGGKSTLAARIVALLPPHEHYMEPFCGGSSVLLTKAPSTMETINDLDGRLIYLDMSSRRAPSRRADVCGIFFRAGLAGRDPQARGKSQLAERP